jgi:exonuclease III
MTRSITNATNKITRYRKKFYIPNLVKTQPSSNNMSVKIITYNVLSSKLCSPGWFPKCAPINLKAKNRFPKIFNKLEKEMKDGEAIVCLQEIPIDWVGEFHTSFNPRGYYLVHSLYGGRKNGYMGVGIAYPLSRYTMQQCEMDCIALTKKWPEGPPPPPKPTGAEKLLSEARQWAKWGWNQVSNRLWPQPPPPRPQENPWDMSQRRHNRAIMLKLALKNDPTYRPFWIGTYHMPCAYYNPPVMTIHSALVAKRLLDLAAGDPCVLAGDFNFKPLSPPYQLFTGGEFEDAQTDPETDPLAYIPAPRPNDKWVPEIQPPFRSAYKVHDGIEPEFTNYAESRDNPPFIACLDYIFISEGIEVESVLKLPRLEGFVDPPLPNSSEPSDHLMIGAVLRMPPSVETE